MEEDEEYPGELVTPCPCATFPKLYPSTLERVSECIKDRNAENAKYFISIHMQVHKDQIHNCKLDCMKKTWVVNQAGFGLLNACPRPRILRVCIRAGRQARSQAGVKESFKFF